MMRKDIKEKQLSETFLGRMVLSVWIVLANAVWGYQGMPTPKLHVEGRFLKDPSGKNVLLHGWMQPTATWFNGQGRWYSDPSDWTNPNNVAGMLNYLKSAATLMSDTSPRYGRDHGWYCSFVRVNTDTIGGWTHESGLVNPAQFNGWIQNFLVPYADHLRSRGLYLVLSATGPINTPNNGTHNAGVVEQQRLITFWQTVASAPGIKNADNVMFELMNEPVDIESEPGNGDWGNHAPKYFQAFRDWIQPVIDAIRSTGAENVIWVPTLEWQGSPYQHALYPFSGTNCGIAAHFYPAYGGVFDNTTALQNLWNSQYKPAADLWPMIITECFWTPMPEDPWNLVNGRTAYFGNALKNAMDNQGNVSYLVGFLGDLLDDLNQNLPADCSLSLREGAQAYFDWLPTYTWAAPSDRPRGLFAAWQTETQVNLTWVGVPDALGYTIKRSSVSGGPYDILAADVAETSFGDTTAGPEGDYYVVSAIMPNGESPNSNEASPVDMHAYLRFDENSGTTAFDSTGRGWNGILNQGAAWTEGRAAAGVSLDGINDFVSLPAGVVNGLTDCTISVWVYLNSIGTWSRVFDFGSGTGVNMFLTPRHSSDSGTVRFAITTDGAWNEQRINGTSALPTGVWTHVAVTFSGNTGILYVNGQEVGRNSSMTLNPSSLGNTTQNYLGRSQYAADPYLNGRIDEFRIYPAAFSQEQITALYRSEIPSEIPSFPAVVSASAVSDSQIDLTWSAVEGASNYIIKRAQTGSGPYTFLAGTGKTSFSDAGLPDSTTYFYVISAVNSLGESADSVPVEATTLPSPPLAPRNLVAASENGYILLNWDANSESDLGGYRIYRSTTPGLYGSALAANVSVNSYIDTTAVSGTVYYYIVTAVDVHNNESPYSNEVFVLANDGRFVHLSGADFESGWGDWINITGEDSHDWIRNTGGTVTPNTGPSGGANGSTWYVYFETSPGWANLAGNTAILQSPLIGGRHRLLMFSYHMYGANIGTLSVDVFSDGVWHQGIWSRSGPQHTSSIQPYSQAIVDLAEFSGPIRIRFRATAAGGPQGDMALDEIEVLGCLMYGDLNGDHSVNLSDLMEFSEFWMQENCASDLDGDCVITLYEFAEFARSWLTD
jgi:hypothetical protein